jgi:Ni/Co efflux regulator RcnB
MKKIVGILMLLATLLSGISVLAQNSNSSTMMTSRHEGRHHRRHHRRWHRRRGTGNMKH